MSPLVSYIVETLVTLLAVVALSILLLYGARRVGIGRPSGPLLLVGRMPLEGRRAVYLVRVGPRIFVLGASEAGMKKLGEVTPEELSGWELDTSMTAPRRFRDVLNDVLDRNRTRNGAVEDSASRSEGSKPKGGT